MQLKARIAYQINDREIALSVRKGAKDPLRKLARRVRRQGKKRIRRMSSRRNARKNPSSPGQSPHSIPNTSGTRHRLIKFVLFAQVDDMTFVVGVQRLTYKNKAAPSLPTPGLHEHGGMGKAHVIMSKDIRRRKVSDARKAELRAKIVKEQDNPKPPKHWEDRRGYSGVKARKSSPAQREAFWVKVVAGKMIVHRDETSDIKAFNRLHPYMYPPRPFMQPAMESVVPDMAAAFKNTIVK